ncbi:unnamed protein product [Peronospora farinosa]|uniref:Uncharacterized protein n=1 Tax=Peronospora farinosa TaxID=134698 RepID=A0AAV0UW91_9STRA|nr:unnamed protein product [Peronospora farinosa]CAI5741119.1 unnamed protein product [Peronospora farinosa]CAI5741127.1 unnamed protein product [Peronospora farinosa]
MATYTSRGIDGHQGFTTQHQYPRLEREAERLLTNFPEMLFGRLLCWMNEDFYVAKNLLNVTAISCSMRICMMGIFTCSRIEGARFLGGNEGKGLSIQELAVFTSLSEAKRDPEDLVRCFAYMLPTLRACGHDAEYRAMEEDFGLRQRIKRRDTFLATAVVL